jgi:hypothetical protein
VSTDLAVDRPREQERSRSLRWTLVPLGIFLLTRVVDAVWLMIAVRQQGPITHSPHEVVPVARQPGTYSNVIQNWDGQWFRLIAEQGYPHTLPLLHGAVWENQWAFYPLFPGLTKLVMLVTHTSYAVSASILNLSLAAVGMCVLFAMIRRTAGQFAAVMSVVVACTFPTAVVYQAAYSEALTFLLLVSSLFLLSRRRYGAMVVTGLLLSLTRPIVLPLALATAVHALIRWRRRDTDPFPRAERVRIGVAAASLVASFAIWPVIGWIVTGNRDAYTASIKAWKVDLDQPLHYESWLSQAVTGYWTVLVLVVVAVALQAFLLLRPAARLWPVELRAWSFSYAAYLLVATRPQGSFTRHLMMALVPWWPFPEVGEAVPARRQQVLLACVVGALGLASQYFWIHWFWVKGPAWIAVP